MPDIETLQMALIGYRAEGEKLTQKIDELQHALVAATSYRATELHRDGSDAS